MGKFKFLILFLIISTTIENQCLETSSYEVESNDNQKIDSNTAIMLRKLTYLYEDISKQWLNQISQPNQEVSRVQELAYNIGFIKEVLGYTNAIIDSIKLEELD